MANSPHVNHYKKRQVAQANEKGCAVCYRPTETVLMSVDSKDWFYCCARHLKDPGCASPIINEAAEKERLQQIEIQKVKAEYELKQKKKSESKEEKDKEEKEKDKKSAASSWLSNPFSSSSKSDKAATPEPVVAPPAPEPTEFALHRTMYQHRVNLKVQAAQRKAVDSEWARLQFPSVPGK